MPATMTRTANPDCHACCGTGIDVAFGSKCSECDRPTGGARRTADARTIRTTPADRFHTPGERLDGRTFGRGGAPSTFATEAQVRFLETLVNERIPFADSIDREGREFCRTGLHTLRAIRNGVTIDRREMSRIIDEVKQVRIPRADRADSQRWNKDDVTVVPALPDVPAGHYAITSTGDNDLVFYRVDRPTTGAYAGRVFVKMVVGGHPDQNVRRDAIPGILARIAADADAGPRYGREIGRCCRCNRTLTDEVSRSLGIGPDCRSRG